MTSLISMFIDDEMDLDEKIEFIETVCAEDFFAQETLAFLDQEKVLRGRMVKISPRLEIKMPYDLKRFFKSWRLGAAVVAALFIFLFVFMPRSQQTAQPLANRFIIYRPDVKQVDITGTFTQWARVPMIKIGGTGYWELSLGVSAGEHRYTYILDGNRSYADPTRPARETDDFGGHNSVIFVAQKV